MFSQEGEEDRSSRGSTLNSNVARHDDDDDDDVSTRIRFLCLVFLPFPHRFTLPLPFFFSHLCFAQPTCHERSTEERERIEQKKTRKFAPRPLFFPLSFFSPLFFFLSLSFFLFLYFFPDFPSNRRTEFLVRVGGWIVAFDIPRYLSAIIVR